MKTMRLIQGIRYGAESLRNRFAGWTPEDADTDGYSIDAYFADDGEYLGPDQHGVEPLFEPADFSARRTGEASLEFAGEEVSEMWLERASSSRSFHLKLYHTPAGTFVGACTLHTEWDGEDHYHTAAIAETIEDVPAMLRGLWPEGVIGTAIGFPPGAQFVEKQRRLEGALRNLFDRSISAILDDAGIVERLQ